jgi:hypothetical protein
MKPKSQKVYMIHLSGQGDTIIKFVGKDTFDFLTTETAPVPTIQIQKYEADYAEDRERAVTNGWNMEQWAESKPAPEQWIAEMQEWRGSSPDNDRAMGIFDEFEPDYVTSLHEAMRLAKKRNYTVVDTYEGYIY